MGKEWGGDTGLTGVMSRSVGLVLEMTLEELEQVRLGRAVHGCSR
jgi:hypothetical protein